MTSGVLTATAEVTTPKVVVDFGLYFGALFVLCCCFLLSFLFLLVVGSSAVLGSEAFAMTLGMSAPTAVTCAAVGANTPQVFVGTGLSSVLWVINSCSGTVSALNFESVLTCLVCLHSIGFLVVTIFVYDC